MPEVKARKFSDIGALIKAEREYQGITQAELAQQLVFSRDYLVDLEAGKPNLYITRLFRVMNYLGISVTLSYANKKAEESNG